MGSDLSRVRFDALRDLSGVVLQQGRVLLDADFNELVDLLDRRLRANAMDLGSTGPRPGTAGVAVVPRTTPDAFRVQPDGDDLRIGVGRMYVDGLLAEHHGDPADLVDPLLRDRVGDKATRYSEQPYWPTPDPLPTAGTHLVYLDVWERELTALEAPDLVEQALGVDTTARRQTVWQVRVHQPGSDALGCDTPDALVAGWNEVIAPSGGRLTTGTVPVDDDDDPCVLPPSGGYRGLENQTYRVEVHEGGPAGTATFKWSRDNAHVASRVVEVLSPTRIRPATLGRDGSLRLRTDDWVEVLDDHRELGQRPGELRRIVVHEEDGTVELATALPADLVMTADDAATRNLRVRRWDQRGTVRAADGTVVTDLDAAGADGTITVPAGGEAVVLEHGVTVTLTTDGSGRFRPGDHWVFAARVADTSVEALVDQPPLGVQHHYARLGVVTFPALATDCRVLWPPEPGKAPPTTATCGDCSVCVTPTSHNSGVLTIQDAVDQVATSGGTVCLSVGRYRLEEPVRLDGARSVRVHGQGPLTVLLARSSAFVVERSIAVTIEDLTVLSGGAEPLVHLRATVGATVRRTVLLAGGSFDGAGAEPSSGMLSHGHRTAGTATGGAAGIRLSGVSIRPLLRDNVIVALLGVVGGLGERTGVFTAAMEISGNLMATSGAGVALVDTVAHAANNVIRDNTVINSRLGGIASNGLVGPGGSVLVEGNTVRTSGFGVAVGPGGFTVRANTVVGQDEPTGFERDGIVVVGSRFGDVAGEHKAAETAGSTTIEGNTVRDVHGAGISVEAPVDDLHVRDNVVDTAASGIVMTGRASCSSANVVGNTVRDVGGREADDVPGGACGIRVLAAGRANVARNVVQGVGTNPGAADLATGIRVVATLDCDVADNSVLDVGPQVPEGPVFGIRVGPAYGRATVHDNTVRRVQGDESGRAKQWTALLIGDGFDGDGETVEITRDRGHTTVLTGRAAHDVDARRSSAIVTGNHLGGSGNTPTANITARADLTVQGNQVLQPEQGGPASLVARADTASVQGNRVDGEPSIELDVDPRRAAVVGNVARTVILVGGSSLQPPWDSMNVEGI